MNDPTYVRSVMLPPAGFVEHAVERGLSEVVAEEALRDVERDVVSGSAPSDPSNGEVSEMSENEPSPGNDVAVGQPRRRRDSGIISGTCIDDRPTLPYMRAARAHED